VPFAFPAELPPVVRDHIADDHGRRLFMHVFNNAWERGDGRKPRSARRRARSNAPVGARGRTASGGKMAATFKSAEAAVCYHIRSARSWRRSSSPAMATTSPNGKWRVEMTPITLPSSITGRYR
jgi:cation transport regulator ChaB